MKSLRQPIKLTFHTTGTGVMDAGADMARHLLYYINEKSIFKDYRNDKLDYVRANYVFKKLKSHYKFGHYLDMNARAYGRCMSYIIEFNHAPDLQDLVHEVAHALQQKRRKKERNNGMTKKKRYHTKEHTIIMKRIYKYILPRLDKWLAFVDKREYERLHSLELKAKKEKEKISLRKTTDYKLELIMKNIKHWESKKKRAENALNKLHRRERFYLRKSAQAADNIRQCSQVMNEVINPEPQHSDTSKHE